MQQILDGLAGKPVTQKTIIGNSIEVWLGVAPMDKDALVIWADPPWRLETAGRVVSTSAEFPGEPEDGESDEAYRARFGAACAASDGLKEATLVSASVDPQTSDIELIFDGGQKLRTFTVWRDESWHLRDYGQNKRYRVAIDSVKIEPID